MSKRNDAGHAKPKSRARRLTLTLLAVSALAASGYALAAKRLTISPGKPEA